MAAGRWWQYLGSSFEALEVIQMPPFECWEGEHRSSTCIPHNIWASWRIPGGMVWGLVSPKGREKGCKEVVIPGKQPNGFGVT